MLGHDEPTIEVNSTSGLKQGLADLLQVCGMRPYSAPALAHEPATLEVHSIEKAEASPSQDTQWREFCYCTQGHQGSAPRCQLRIVARGRPDGGEGGALHPGQQSSPS